MEAGELAGVCVDSNRLQKISAAQGNHRAGRTVCVMAVGGKSALHSAGDVAQSEMEAQRVLACVSAAKCAKCQNMRYTKYNKADFFFFPCRPVVAHSCGAFISISHQGK